MLSYYIHPVHNVKLLALTVCVACLCKILMFCRGQKEKMSFMNADCILKAKILAYQLGLRAL